MGSNFKVKIDPYVIAKVDDIDYYYFEKFGNFEMGILLTKELKDAKETIQDNPYIGRRIDDNIYKYVILDIKSVLNYEIHEDSNTIIIFDLKAFKENRRKND